MTEGHPIVGYIKEYGRTRLYRWFLKEYDMRPRYKRIWRKATLKKNMGEGRSTEARCRMLMHIAHLPIQYSGNLPPAIVVIYI